MKVDAIDQKIIDELVADARMSLADLAEKVGITRQSVRHRLDRLEGCKIIKGYTAILADPALDDIVSALILVYRKDRMRGVGVTDAISKIPEVEYCSIMSGELDLMVHITANSSGRVSEIWAEISRLEGVQNTTTCFTLSAVIDRRRG
ncbi:Lrp/AsnC family transcriptional regulator [Paraburkholderia sp. J8-2]|uniref:Lrp/AsnC family transcriptional regulator n=1 Tax=Paraburkholderia sp. J8-2 TaxID=2805440 RepID=UPI002AB780FE|nr:Lrp/AsnC family transcriptional regulator [Paraburkholderia sp. J8-2]